MFCDKYITFRGRGVIIAYNRLIHDTLLNLLYMSETEYYEILFSYYKLSDSFVSFCSCLGDRSADCRVSIFQGIPGEKI